MPDYTRNTGTSGEMRIRDNGTTIEFGIKGPSGLSIPQLPWQYAGKYGSSDWQSFNFQSSGGWQTLGVFNVPSTQAVGLTIGSTGTSLGGPTSLTTWIYRNTESDTTEEPGYEEPGYEEPGEEPGEEPPPPPSLRAALITVGTEVKLAIPFVNVNGVWRQAESWGKVEGVWKQVE